MNKEQIAMAKEAGLLVDHIGGKEYVFAKDELGRRGINITGEITKFTELLLTKNVPELNIEMAQAVIDSFVEYSDSYGGDKCCHCGFAWGNFRLESHNKERHNQGCVVASARAMIAATQNIPIKPRCAISGTLHGGRAMCGFFDIDGLKYCELPKEKGRCEHQLNSEKSVDE